MGVDPFLQPVRLRGRDDDLVSLESVNGEEALTTRKGQPQSGLTSASARKVGGTLWSWGWLRLRFRSWRWFRDGGSDRDVASQHKPPP